MGSRAAVRSAHGVLLRKSEKSCAVVMHTTGVCLRLPGRQESVFQLSTIYRSSDCHRDLQQYRALEGNFFRRKNVIALSLGDEIFLAFSVEYITFHLSYTPIRHNNISIRKVRIMDRIMDLCMGPEPKFFLSCRDCPDDPKILAVLVTLFEPQPPSSNRQLCSEHHYAATELLDKHNLADLDRAEVHLHKAALAHIYDWMVRGPSCETAGNVLTALELSLELHSGTDMAESEQNATRLKE
ncbi:hypothetical protein LTR95_002851 [Oleoguttula sp. CCFEE 5521]